MNIAVLGIDLGKNVCSLVGLGDAGAVVLRRRVKRKTLIVTTHGAFGGVAA